MNNNATTQNPFSQEDVPPLSEKSWKINDEVIGWTVWADAAEEWIDAAKASPLMERRDNHVTRWVKVRY